jgi:hypothetical protein
VALLFLALLFLTLRSSLLASPFVLAQQRCHLFTLKPLPAIAENISFLRRISIFLAANYDFACICKTFFSSVFLMLQKHDNPPFISEPANDKFL